MKTSDLAMIVLIASFSVMVAFFIANSLPFLKVDEQSTKVPTIQAIPSGISEQPDATVFNKDAINPTVRTVIGREE